MREGGSKKKKPFHFFRLAFTAVAVGSKTSPCLGEGARAKDVHVKWQKKKCMRMTRFERAAVRWQRLYGSVGLASLGLAPFSGGGRSTAELHPLLSLAHELKRDLSK